MIEPQVLHGGASSWFWMAANEEDFDVPDVDGAATVSFGIGTGFPPSPSTGSRMFTPAAYCASGLRNLVAIYRKM